MARYTDQAGRRIEVAEFPRQIISVVPSQTELLYDLGLEEQVIGITKFCIHPDKWFRSKTRVGGTKQLKMDLILSMKPDLIIANKEENDQLRIEELSRHFPVWISDIRNLGDAKKMILTIGEMTGRFFQSVELLRKIDVAFDSLSVSASVEKTLQVAYLIWNDPLMAAGGDTFISDMLSECGFENAFRSLDRYPEITLEQLENVKPDLVFLSSEPFPFGEKHLQEFRTRLPSSRITLVDGEMFSWYGSRLQLAPAYFLSLFEQIKTVK